MNWEEYASTVVNLYNRLQEKGWSTDGGQNSEVMRLLNLYFISGAYIDCGKGKDDEYCQNCGARMVNADELPGKNH